MDKMSITDFKVNISYSDTLIIGYFKPFVGYISNVLLGLF